jgi:RNA polymerase sigma-70 factor (ECF subfamily)
MAPMPMASGPQAESSAAASETERVLAMVREAQAGDRRAMEDLICHFQDRVWRRARYRIGDPDEASEVAQEVFLICFRKLHQFRGESHFWTWLARITDNQVRNRMGWWRRRRQGQTFSLQELWQGEEDDGQQQEWDPPDPSPSPRQQAAGREVMGALEDKLGELSSEHREILLLRFADGLSYEEISDQLGIELGTVKSRINRARAELRVKMDRFL